MITALWHRIINKLDFYKIRAVTWQIKEEDH